MILASAINCILDWEILNMFYLDKGLPEHKPEELVINTKELPLLSIDSHQSFGTFNNYVSVGLRNSSIDAKEKAKKFVEIAEAYLAAALWLEYDYEPAPELNYTEREEITYVSQEIANWDNQATWYPAQYAIQRARETEVGDHHLNEKLVSFTLLSYVDGIATFKCVWQWREIVPTTINSGDDS